MQNWKKILGLPKMCSNYTSKLKITEIIEIQGKKGIIFKFWHMMKSDIFSMTYTKIH